MKEKSVLEKLSGSLSVEIGGTLLASLAGGPAAALLPVLTNTLANGRHQTRVQNAIEELEAELSTMTVKMNELTDAQYKFISENTLTIFQTPDEEKIHFLKEAIYSVIDQPDLPMERATLTSRMLRDITVPELRFVIEYSGKTIYTGRDEPKENDVFIDRTIEKNRTTIDGLMSLGLLSTIQGMVFGVVGYYYFTDSAKAIVSIFETES